MKNNATDHKPATISSEDWSHTPPPVQTLIKRLVKKQKQDEAHLRYIQERLRQSLAAKLPETLPLVTKEEPEGGILLVVDDNEKIVCLLLVMVEKRSSFDNNFCLSF